MQKILFILLLIGLVFTVVSVIPNRKPETNSDKDLSLTQTDMSSTLIDKIKTWPFHLLPHHLISRMVYQLTRIESPLAVPVMRWFSHHFGIVMTEAAEPDFKAYPTFNAFFTRALKPGSRPIAEGEATVVSPVDGTVSQVGRVTQGRIFQAKNVDYSLHELLGGFNDLAVPFENGYFATIYLSPKDYHRIHMPLAGNLTHMIHVPGRLFSVAPYTVRALPGLFARNERVVSLFETSAGPMAMVLVGAINVAAIETVWAGLVTPPAGKAVHRLNYSEQSVSLTKGAEMGRFNMGSTVILLFPDTVQWDDSLRADVSLKMGQAIADLKTSP